MIDSTTGETWRFSTHTNGEYMGEPVTVIQRGRAYQLPSDWTTDAWRNYWDCDGMVAFIDGGYRHGTYAVTENPDTERAITAYRYSGEEALVPLAKRLLPESVEVGNTPAFISVGLDRGVDLYVLAWDGDPEGKWRDEIEAVYHGDVWRVEVQEYDASTGTWADADDMCVEWYGEDVATAAFEREFELAEFPAELLVCWSGSDH